MAPNSIISCLALALFSHRAETYAEIKCWDQICEYKGTVINCYRPNKRCAHDEITDKLSCIETYSKKDKPSLICENDTFHECVCRHDEEKRAHCSCSIKHQAKVAVCASAVCVLLVLMCGLCFTRWYINKKEKVKLHIIMRERQKAEDEAERCQNSSDQDRSLQDTVANGTASVGSSTGEGTSNAKKASGLQPASYRPAPPAKKISVAVAPRSLQSVPKSSSKISVASAPKPVPKSSSTGRISVAVAPKPVPKSLSAGRISVAVAPRPVPKSSSRISVAVAPRNPRL